MVAKPSPETKREKPSEKSQAIAKAFLELSGRLGTPEARYAARGIAEHLDPKQPHEHS